MKYIEAPQKYMTGAFERSIFLAGGITGCPDWQKDLVDKYFSKTDLTIFNPRRANFDITNPLATEEQIIWEFDHLRSASEILFWFCKEQIQPIALYELGAWSMKSKPLHIGVHPEYARRKDVMIQTALARGIKVVDSLEALVGRVLG